MEYIACPLCGSKRSRLLFSKPDLDFKMSDDLFSVVRCRDCGLSFVNPRPDETEIGRFYPDSFYRTTLTKEELLQNQEKQLELKLRYIPDMQTGRVLDVGCSRGEFLYVMQQKGWEVQGVDFSERPMPFFDIDIFRGTLQQARFPEASFDLVTLWAVLEHIHQPKELLQEVHRVLKPGGRVVLLVTNMRSIPARHMHLDDIPRHLIMFHPPSLKRILAETGFQQTELSWNSQLFGGSHRGVLNFIVKRLAGERFADILAQYRSLERWPEFSTQINKRQSPFMLKVDRFDIKITPSIDRIMDRLGLGFIMLASASKI